MRPEDSLQATVCAYLDQALPDTAWYCSIPNGAVLSGDRLKRARQMAKLKRTGLKVGAPDLLIIYQGRSLGIELKATDGSQSASQKGVQSALLQAGALYWIARSVDDVQRFLDAAGLPLKARAA